MLNPVSALRWEISRSLGIYLLFTTFAAMLVAGCTVLQPIVEYAQGTELTPKHLLISADTHLVVTVLMLLIVLFGVGQGIGMSTRQYTLPVSSAMLASARLFPGAICCGGLYLIFSVVLNVVFRAGWPCIGPTLTYGLSFMVMYAVVYRFRGNDRRIGIAGGVAGIAIVLWVLGHYFAHRRWGERPERWIEFSNTELLLVASIAYCAWRSLVDAIDRDRSGRGWGRVVVSEASESMAVLTDKLRLEPTMTRRARSPVTALFWQEWKQDGWLIPCVLCGLMLMVAIVNVLSLIFSSAFRGDGHDLDMVSIITTFIPICVIAPWFASLATTPAKRALYQKVWPTRQSTLPVSDSLLGWIIFARALASTLVGLLGILLIGATWIIATEIVLRVYSGSMSSHLSLSGYSPILFRRIRPAEIAGYIALITFIAWMAAGLGTATSLSGRRWIASIPLAMIPVAIGVAIFCSALPYPTNMATGNFLLCTVPGLLLIGMIASYASGIMSGLVAWHTLVLAVLVIVLAEAIGVTCWQLNFGTTNWANFKQPSILYAWMIVWSLAAAPFSLIPLATHYNRHR